MGAASASALICALFTVASIQGQVTQQPFRPTGRLDQFQGFVTPRPQGFFPDNTRLIYSSEWASWSAWSFCVNNIQIRVRACNTVRGFSCLGPNQETEPCEHSIHTTSLPRRVNDDYDIDDPDAVDRMEAMRQLYPDSQDHRKNTKIRKRIYTTDGFSASEESPNTIAPPPPPKKQNPNFMRFSTPTPRVVSTNAPPELGEKLVPMKQGPFVAFSAGKTEEDPHVIGDRIETELEAFENLPVLREQRTNNQYQSSFATLGQAGFGRRAQGIKTFSDKNVDLSELLEEEPDNIEVPGVIAFASKSTGNTKPVKFAKIHDNDVKRKSDGNNVNRILGSKNVDVDELLGGKTTNVLDKISQLIDRQIQEIGKKGDNDDEPKSSELFDYSAEKEEPTTREAPTTTTGAPELTPKTPHEDKRPLAAIDSYEQLPEVKEKLPDFEQFSRTSGEKLGRGRGTIREEKLDIHEEALNQGSSPVEQEKKASSVEVLDKLPDPKYIQRPPKVFRPRKVGDSLHKTKPLVETIASGEGYDSIEITSSGNGGEFSSGPASSAERKGKFTPRPSYLGVNANNFHSILPQRIKVDTKRPHRIRPRPNATAATEPSVDLTDSAETGYTDYSHARIKQKRPNTETTRVEEKKHKKKKEPLREVEIINHHTTTPVPPSDDAPLIVSPTISSISPTTRPKLLEEELGEKRKVEELMRMLGVDSSSTESTSESPPPHAKTILEEASTENPLDAATEGITEKREEQATVPVDLTEAELEKLDQETKNIDKQIVSIFEGEPTKKPKKVLKKKLSDKKRKKIPRAQKAVAAPDQRETPIGYDRISEAEEVKPYKPKEPFSSISHKGLSMSKPEESSVSQTTTDIYDNGEKKHHGFGITGQKHRTINDASINKPKTHKKKKIRKLKKVHPEGLNDDTVRALDFMMRTLAEKEKISLPAPEPPKEASGYTKAKVVAEPPNSSGNYAAAKISSKISSYIATPRPVIDSVAIGPPTGDTPRPKKVLHKAKGRGKKTGKYNRARINDGEIHAGAAGISKRKYVVEPPLEGAPHRREIEINEDTLSRAKRVLPALQRKSTGWSSGPLSNDPSSIFDMGDKIREVSFDGTSSSEILKTDPEEKELLAHIPEERRSALEMEIERLEKLVEQGKEELEREDLPPILDLPREEASLDEKARMIVEATQKFDEIGMMSDKKKRRGSNDETEATTLFTTGMEVDLPEDIRPPPLTKSLFHRRGSNIPPKKLDGAWTEWSRWGTCLCGEQLRTRSCEMADGTQTMGCQGSTYESRSCEGGECPMEELHETTIPPDTQDPFAGQQMSSTVIEKEPISEAQLLSGNPEDDPLIFAKH